MKKATSNFDYRTINSVDAAFKKQNLERLTLTDIPAKVPERFRLAWLRVYELFVVFEAINNGWVPDWNNQNEYKYFPWFEIKVSGSGFVFANSYSDYACTHSTVGSRLCTDRSEKALFIAEIFGKEYADLFLIPALSVKMVSMDGDDPVSMAEFIAVNTPGNIHPITQDEIGSLNKLEVGEEITIGICKIKRVQ